MTVVSFPWLAIAVLLVQGLATAPVSCAEPSIRTLVAGVPIIEPGNMELGAFRVDIEFPSMLATVTLACDGSSETNMLVTAGRQNTPVWFVSENKGMTFDAASGSVMIYNDVRTRCVIQDDGKVIRYGVSFGQGEDATVKLDLPSILHPAAHSRKLDQTELGHWRITAKTELGSLVIAKFAKSKPFAIRELEVWSATGDKQLIAFRNIEFHEQANTKWPKFPDAELLRSTVKVFSAGERNLNDAAWLRHAMRTITVHSAVDNPVLRESLPESTSIDWDALKRTTEQVTPALRALLCTSPDGQ